MSHLFQLRKYLRHLLLARDEHHIHSPFVFDLYTKVICQKDLHPGFEKIEGLRSKLLKSKSKITVTDFGSGSIVNNGHLRPVSAITKNSLKTRKFARLLYRLVKFQQPKILLELGTSIGISSLYQLLAVNNESEFYTMEGCPEISKIALSNFEDTRRKINLIEGNIDQTLPALLDRLAALDYVFFDANHSLEPTLRYFELCLKKKNENTLFIFDDIHRSFEMDSAWNEIKKSKQVNLTIDLFEFGLVFFKNHQPKQDFILKF